MLAAAKQKIKKIEGLALIMKREPKGNKILMCWTYKEFGHYSTKYPKKEKKFKPRKAYKSRVPKDYFYVNADGDFDFKMADFFNDSDDENDDEIGFVAIKEESHEKEEIKEERALVSQVEKKQSDWIIHGGYSHHMIGDMNKFVEFNSYDGGIVRVGNNAACHIKGKGSITLDGRTNTKDVYFVDDLKHNLLSVGQLIDKAYQLQFTEKICIIKDKNDTSIGFGTRTRGNVF